MVSASAGEPARILSDVSGGRVLDVATGTGGFVRFLVDGLHDFDEIIGIDARGDREAAFAAALAGVPGVRFERMDARRLAFPAASFDTVCISNSLHHFADPDPVLAEMRRVLRPGGHFVVNEMYRDGQSQTQRTHVLLHHWWAAVNRLHGEEQRETYERAQIVALVEGLGLADLCFFDLADPGEDPHDPAMIGDLEAAIDRHIEMADGHHDLQARGEVLRARLREIGARGATQLVAIGRA